MVFVVLGSVAIVGFAIVKIIASIIDLGKAIDDIAEPHFDVKEFHKQEVEHNGIKRS